MFGKKTAEEVLKLINGLSDEEKAALMERLGVKAETASAEDEGETPEEAAAEEADEAKKDESKAEEETTYAEDDAEKAEIAEDVAEGDKDPAPAEEEKGEDAPEEERKEDDGTAEAIAAIGARIDALESGLADRIAALESFMDAIRSEDAKEKGEMGLNRAEELRKEAQESYLDYRKRTIGV